MAKKRGTRAEVAARWRERIARWQRLQCSITEFCRRERISQPSFFQWRKRLAAAGEGQAHRRQPAVAPRGAAFIPVQVVASTESVALRNRQPASEDVACLEISCGELVCRVPTHVDESTLRRLVRVLREEAARC